MTRPYNGNEFVAVLLEIHYGTLKPANRDDGICATVDRAFGNPKESNPYTELCRVWNCMGMADPVYPLGKHRGWEDGKRRELCLRTAEFIVQHPECLQLEFEREFGRLWYE